MIGRIKKSVTSSVSRAISFLIFTLLFHLGYAQTTSSSTNAVIQNESLAVLMGKYKAYNKEVDFTDGYRVQIMFTDVRDDVYKSKGVLYNQFPEIKSYVEYEQPYYKLRVGDFKTRLEATYYLQQIIPLYGSAFIVRDKIKIR
jgi:hypothetical protein